MGSRKRFYDAVYVITIGQMYCSHPRRKVTHRPLGSSRDEDLKEMMETRAKGEGNLASFHSMLKLRVLDPFLNALVMSSLSGAEGKSPA